VGEQPLSRSIAIWVAWVAAGAAGTLLPTMDALGIPYPVSNFYPYGQVLGVIVSATWLALFQYVVARALLRRVSLELAMWIPATVLAAVGTFIFVQIWQSTVPRTLISISAMSASLPPGFPMFEITDGLAGLVMAALVGLSQGIVLSKVFGRNVVGFWLLANMLAGLVEGTVLGIRHQAEAGILLSQFTDDATLTTFFVVNTLIGAVLLAAVTGPALLFLAGRGLQMPTQPYVSSAVS
jgi:hypothetical protein